MRERAVTFGPGRSLAGVWAEPSGGSDVADRPAVIILNSGIVHHVGAWRLHTRAARALVDVGFPSLRFDLSGIGDSDSPREAAPLGELVLRDLASAVDYVEQVHGRRRLVMMGLCSGARDALEAAVLHTNVVGTVAIDLMSDFRTWQHHVAHFGPRLLRWQSWKNALTLRTQRIRRIGSVVSREDESLTDPTYALPPTSGPRSRLSRGGLRQMSATLLSRDLQLLFAFSNGLEDNYNHRSQFAEALPEIARDPRTSVLFFPEADHTFTDRAQQRALLTAVVDWLDQRFP